MFVPDRDIANSDECKSDRELFSSKCLCLGTIFANLDITNKHGVRARARAVTIGTCNDHELAVDLKPESIRRRVWLLKWKSHLGFGFLNGRRNYVMIFVQNRSYNLHFWHHSCSTCRQCQYMMGLLYYVSLQRCYGCRYDGNYKRAVLIYLYQLLDLLVVV